MLPFPIQVLPGQPIYDQIVHAVKRALASGQLKPGDRFPAVRAISAELGVNPNTVQRAATVLIKLGILEVRFGQGSFVAEQMPAADEPTRSRALRPLVENLLIEAARLGVGEEELLALIQTESRKLKTP